MPEHSRMNDESKSRCILMSTRRRPLSPRMGDKGDVLNKDHLPDIPRCLCVDSQHRVPVSPQSADLQRGVVHTFQQRPYLCFRGSDIRVRRRFQASSRARSLRSSKARPRKCGTQTRTQRRYDGAGGVSTGRRYVDVGGRGARRRHGARGARARSGAELESIASNYETMARV
jgi:hypothetical protein